MLPKVDSNTSYEELCKIEDELFKNPNTPEEDLIYIVALRGDKEIELGYTYTLEEVYKELLGKDIN